MGRSPDKCQFEEYLNGHSNLLKSVVRSFNCTIREDVEDLIAEGQRVLWDIYNSPKKDSTPALIRVILKRRLSDYLREVLPLSLTHFRHIENGHSLKVKIINLLELDELWEEANQDAIDDCIDSTFLAGDNVLILRLREMLKMLLEGRTESEIMDFFEITPSTFRSHVSDIRRRYLKWLNGLEKSDP